MLGMILVLHLVASPAISQVTADDAPLNSSRFARTVIYLQQASPEEQEDFAAAALAELAEVYLAEADLARGDARRAEGRSRSRLLGWSVAVDQYASQLMLLLDDMEQGYSLALWQSPEGSATVTVADRPVILEHPRADQQAAYEQRVLADFCGSHDCQKITARVPGPEPIPVAITRVNPLWTFTQTGPVCSNEGLEVHFGSTRNLATLRGICDELVRELAALATELAWQSRHGVQIDWENLSIAPTPGRPEHLVRLGAGGDAVLLTVPLLFSSPQLVADTRPWLRARAAGEKPGPIRLDAAKYGWLEIPPD